MKLFGKNLKIDLLLAINFLMIPTFLPLFEGEFLSSLSLYAYSSQYIIYYLLMSTCALLLLMDGIIDGFRRYNMIMASLLLGVVFFPAIEWQLTHDTLAISFFVGNVYIVTWHTTLLTKIRKIVYSIIIGITLILLFADVFNLYVAESVGMLCMSHFMYNRYCSKYKNNLVV